MKKKVLQIAFANVIGMILLLVSFNSGCWIIDKNNILNAYESENSLFYYYTFKAKITSVRQVNNEFGKYFSLCVDQEYFREHNQGKDHLVADGSSVMEAAIESFDNSDFCFTKSNMKIIEEQGAESLLIEDAVVIITVNNYYGWAGWIYPILSIIINEATYLDFEIGKSNYLNYVRAGFKEVE